MDCAAFFGDGGIDAGQYLRESVKIIVPGANHGWNLREGNHAFDPENPHESLAEVPQAGCRGEPLVDAIVEYPNAGQPGGIGAVVIGGYVYRGSALPGPVGRYVSGEWNRAGADGDGIIFVATENPRGLWEFTEVEVAGSRAVGSYVLAFGEDAEHEHYVLTSKTGGRPGRRAASTGSFRPDHGKHHRGIREPGSGGQDRCGILR